MQYFKYLKAESFSVLHVNIRSLNKNFEKLKLLLSKIYYSFKFICLTETWCKDEHLENNSNYHLNNYTAIHQERKSNKKGGGVCCFVHNSIIYKKIIDIRINDEDTEALSIEIINTKTKNLIITNVYRPPNGKIKPFKNFFKELVSKNKRSGKILYIVGDLNLNILDYETNNKVKNFFNLIFSFNLIPVINKVTRVTKKSATAIDHIIKNSYLNANIQTGIIKTDISDHFPISLVTNTPNINAYSKTTTIYKRYINTESINTESIEYFRSLLNYVTWEELQCPDEAYNSFLRLRIQNSKL